MTTSAPAGTGFGFAQVMRTPDYSRFPTWYARVSRVGSGRQG